MEKRFVKPLIILILTLILLVLATYTFKYLKSRNSTDMQQTVTPSSNNSATSTGMMTEAEKKALGLDMRANFEVISRNKDGQIASYRGTSTITAQPVALEWMTDAEKIWRRLATSTRVQVLERNSAGEITAFKIIKSDADIVSAY